MYVSYGGSIDADLVKLAIARKRYVLETKSGIFIFSILCMFMMFQYTGSVQKDIIDLIGLKGWLAGDFLFQTKSFFLCCEPSFMTIGMTLAHVYL